MDISSVDIDDALVIEEDDISDDEDDDNEDVSHPLFFPACTLCSVIVVFATNVKDIAFGNKARQLSYIRINIPKRITSLYHYYSYLPGCYQSRWLCTLHVVLIFF